MLSKLTAFVAGFSLAAALLISLVAFGQDEIRARITPTVIDIQQSVPVLADIDGASVPITVDIALQVSLSGPVTVSTVAEAPAPVVAVSTATPSPAVNREAAMGTIVLDGIRWQLLEAYDEGNIWNCKGAMSGDKADTTSAKFGALKFYVENNSNSPTSIRSAYFGIFPDYDMELVDDMDRRFQTFTMGWGCNKKCSQLDLNPGLGDECYVVFELPNDVSGLVVEFGGDPAKQSISIPSLVAP